MTSAGSACPSARAAYRPRPPSITDVRAVRTGGGRGGRPGCRRARRGRVQLLGRASRWPGTPAAPPAELPAMPSALTVVGRSSRISRAATSADENDAARAASRAGRAGGTRAVRSRRSGRRSRSRATAASSASSPVGADLLAHGEHRGEHDGGGVHEAAGVGVVEVQRVHERAGRQRGGRREMRIAAAEQGRLRRTAEPGRHGQPGRRRSERAGGDGRTQPVEQVPAARPSTTSSGRSLAAQAEGPRGEVGGNRHGAAHVPEGTPVARGRRPRRRRSRASRRGSGRRPRCAAAPGGTSAARSPTRTGEATWRTVP